jgi:hypothetical protein
MAESIDITLSATDNATAVIKKSAGEMELLRDRVEQTSKSTAKGTEAIQKFANVMGAGWITDSAAQLKELSEAGKGAMEALKGGGSGALALKAGLVGLTAIASYKIGEVIADWVFQTKKFSEELEAATTKARELGQQMNTVAGRRIDQQVADLKEFGGTFQEQAVKAQDIIRQLNAEIAGKGGQEEKAKADLESLESKRKYYLVSQLEVDNAKANLEIVQQSKKDTQEKRDALVQQYSEAEVNRVKMREQMQSEAEMEKQNIDNRKKLTEAFFKFQEDMAEQYAKEEEKQQKAKEKATLRQKDLEIKAASEAIKATQKEISDLEKVKIDTNTSLQGREERVISRSTAAGGLESQQLANSKKQTMILEKQRELEEKIERHLKLMAEKEDKVVEFSGA